MLKSLFFEVFVFEVFVFEVFVSKVFALKFFNLKVLVTEVFNFEISSPNVFKFYIFRLNLSNLPLLNRIQKYTVNVWMGPQKKMMGIFRHIMPFNTPFDWKIWVFQNCILNSRTGNRRLSENICSAQMFTQDYLGLTKRVKDRPKS